MNCERFQMVAEDLTRGKTAAPPESNQRGLMVMDSNERTVALAHAAACEPCALTLTEQRELSESLRSLAHEMQRVQAPPHLETKLVAAHRSRTRSLSMRSSQPRRLYWITAVAALLLLVLGLTVWRFRPNSEPPQPAQAKLNSGSDPSGGSAGARSSTSLAVNPPIVPSPSGSDDRRTPPKRVKPKASSSARHYAAAQLAKRRREAHDLKERQQALAANAQPAEVATDFVPVGYGSAMDLQEGGQLVRVELPRLALADFGLPVNMDRVDERVKADVLVGPDGLARAIRFVK